MNRITFTLVAGQDLTEKHCLAVAASEAGAVLPEAGKAIAGIVIEGEKANKPIGIERGGVCRVVYGDTVTAGTELEVTAEGKLIPLTTGIAVGYAIESGAADEIHHAIIY